MLFLSPAQSKQRKADKWTVMQNRLYLNPNRVCVCLKSVQKDTFRYSDMFYFSFPFLSLRVLVACVRSFRFEKPCRVIFIPAFFCTTWKNSTLCSSYQIDHKWLWYHEPQASGSAVNFDDVKAKVIFNKRTDYFFLRYKGSKMAKCWE